MLTPLGITGSAAVQSPRDGYIFFSACEASGGCGLYELLIDGNGGVAANSLKKLANATVAPTHIVADRHPVTGTTVLFSGDETKNISVWEQPAAGGVLKLVAKVSATKNEHYRVLNDNNRLVLNYLGATFLTEGSYTIAVSASGAKLIAGASKKLSSRGHGAEIVWLPAVNK